MPPSRIYPNSRKRHDSTNYSSKSQRLQPKGRVPTSPNAIDPRPLSTQHGNQELEDQKDVEHYAESRQSIDGGLGVLDLCAFMIVLRNAVARPSILPARLST